MVRPVLALLAAFALGAPAPARAAEPAIPACAAPTANAFAKMLEDAHPRWIQVVMTTENRAEALQEGAKKLPPAEGPSVVFLQLAGRFDGTIASPPPGAPPVMGRYARLTLRATDCVRIGWGLSDKTFRLARLGRVRRLPVPVPAGTPDPDFGTGGVAYWHQPVGAVLTPVALDVAGSRVVVVGHESGDSPDAASVADPFKVAFRPTGARDTTYVDDFPASLAAVAGAVREPGGRLVVAVYARAYFDAPEPEATSLYGFRPDGRPDPAFGNGGKVALSQPLYAQRLVSAPDGTLLVGGFGAGAARLARVSPDGVELSVSTLRLPAAAFPFPAVQAVLPDSGSVTMLVAGGVYESEGIDRLALVRFTTAGAVDRSFAPGGWRRLRLGPFAASDAALDPAGRIVVAGAYVREEDSSNVLPARPALLRLRPDGTTDASFAPSGRAGGGDAIDLIGVRLDRRGRIYASTESGRLARFYPDGTPDLGFGIGGVSVALPRRLFVVSGLTLTGSVAWMTGETPFGDADAVAVERVVTRGVGRVPPRRRRSVRATRRAGRVTVLVPLSRRPQRLTTSVALALTAAAKLSPYEHPDPIPTRVDTTHGTVRITGVDGWIDVRGAAFGLATAAKGRIARLELRPPECGARRTTTLHSRGDFVVTAGRAHLRTGHEPATIDVIRACGRAPKVERRR